MNNELHFKNGKFKIMQITDTQENAVVNPDTIKLIELSLDKEKPDLVIFTGDQIKGYSKSFSKDTLKKISKTICDILQPLEKRGIPFCVTFGNHDRNCGISNAEQMEKIYRLHNGLISTKPRSDFDTGTFSVQIKDSKCEKDIFNLYVFDSNSKEPDGTYSPVHRDQIEWYKNERERIKEENARYLPSLVFQHIPLPEYFKAVKRVKKHTKGAVEAFYSHKNEYYVLYDDTLKSGGFMLESPAAPDINNGEFDAFKEKGEVLGVFVGHDHNNSFVKNVEGIDLGYTQGCGFNTYGPGANRGVRIFELDENSPEKYKTKTVTMQQLCDFKPSKPVTEFIATHAPSSVKQVKKIIIKGIALVSCVAATAIAFNKLSYSIKRL